jgi:hypothetical protein
MVRLWEKMLSLYGKQWENSNGHVGGRVYSQWAEQLSMFNVNQIKVGLDQLAAEGSDYAPNLVKFMRLCRTVQPAMYKTFAPALPGPKPRRSVLRIEAAKQQALTGLSFNFSKHGTRFIEDWTDDNEAELLALVSGFEYDDDEPMITVLDRLNELVAGHVWTSERIT